MLRRVKLAPILLAVALLAALTAGAAFSSAAISFRGAERDGERVGEVLIGDTAVIVLRTAAAGYLPVERAEIVAGRLRAASEAGFVPQDVEVAPVSGGHALFIGDRIIVTATEAEASAHGAGTAALAQVWRGNIIRAIAPEEAPAAEPAEAPAEPLDLDWTGVAQKWVPIFSLETEGLYLGAAQIAGPTGQVEKVKGVAELRLNFRNVGRVYAYIPVSTISLSRLDRVQGVSVWATGDIGLVGF